MTQKQQTNKGMAAQHMGPRASGHFLTPELGVDRMPPREGMNGKIL